MAPNIESEEVSIEEQVGAEENTGRCTETRDSGRQAFAIAKFGRAEGLAED